MIEVPVAVFVLGPLAFMAIWHMIGQRQSRAAMEVVIDLSYEARKHIEVAEEVVRDAKLAIDFTKGEMKSAVRERDRIGVRTAVLEARLAENEEREQEREDWEWEKKLRDKNKELEATVHTQAVALESAAEFCVKHMDAEQDGYPWESYDDTDETRAELNAAGIPTSEES